MHVRATSQIAATRSRSERAARRTSATTTALFELWFDTLQAAEAALATPEWEAVVKDAATFVDMAAHLGSWGRRARP
jgi:hypothetical protein